MKVHNEEDAVKGASYLIYSETIQRFVGLVRKGDFLMEEPGGGGPARLVFFQAALA